MTKSKVCGIMLSDDYIFAVVAVMVDVINGLVTGFSRGSIGKVQSD
jgi:hypothetical protein